MLRFLVAGNQVCLKQIRPGRRPTHPLAKGDGGNPRHVSPKDGKEIHFDRSRAGGYRKTQRLNQPDPPKQFPLDRMRLSLRDLYRSGIGSERQKWTRQRAQERQIGITGEVSSLYFKKEWPTSTLSFAQLRISHSAKGKAKDHLLTVREGDQAKLLNQGEELFLYIYSYGYRATRLEEECPYLCINAFPYAFRQEERDPYRHPRDR